MNLNEYSIEELEKELAKKKEEERVRLEFENLKPVKLTNFKIEQDTLWFSNEYRDDLVIMLRDIKGRIYGGSKNGVPVDTWLETRKLLLTLPKLEIDMDSEMLNTILNHKPTPAFAISEDDKSFIIVPGPKAQHHIVSSLPSARYLQYASGYRVAFADGWRLALALKDITNVSWDEAASTRCQAQVELRKTLDEIALGDDCTLDVNIGEHKLRNFQCIGTKFLLATGGNGIIGDEMGLGKTPQFISTAEYYIQNNKAKKVLIVCPAALKSNWVREINKFTGKQAFVFFGSSPDKYQLAKWIQGEYNYYIINYDILSERSKHSSTYVDPHGAEKETTDERFLWVDIFNMLPPDIIGCDEIHYIKNVESNRSEAVRKLISKSKIGLSGTLLINRPRELWAPISWINPELVQGYETFVKRYEFDSKTPRNTDELRETLKTIMLRRTKKDVIKELPPINRITREYELTKSAKVRYNEALQGMYRELDGWDGSPGESKRITTILAMIMALKQIAAQDKINYVADLAVECYDSATTDWKKVIVFSQFVNSPPIIGEIANRLAPEAVSFSGEDHPHKRMELVDQFQNDDNIHFLVASTKAAGEGLNITAAGSVIFADLLWTPAGHHQAEGRAYGRLSDMHTINSYYVVAENTIEDTHIMPLLEHKLNLFTEIIDGAESSRNVSIAMDVIRMLKSGGTGGFIK